MTTYDGLVNNDLELIRPVSYLPGEVATGDAFAAALRGSYTLARRSKRVLGQTNYSIDMTNLPKSFTYHTMVGNASWRTVYHMRSFLPKDADTVVAMVSWKSIGPATVTHKVEVTDGTATATSSSVVQVATENSAAWSKANIVTKAGRWFEGGTGGGPKGMEQYKRLQTMLNYEARVPSFTACDPSEISWATIYVDASTLTSANTIWITVSMKAQTSGADASMIPLSCVCWYDIR